MSANFDDLDDLLDLDTGSKPQNTNEREIEEENDDFTLLDAEQKSPIINNSAIETREETEVIEDDLVEVEGLTANTYFENPTEGNTVEEANDIHHSYENEDVEMMVEDVVEEKKDFDFDEVPEDVNDDVNDVKSREQSPGPAEPEHVSDFEKFSDEEEEVLNEEHESPQFNEEYESPQFNEEHESREHDEILDSTTFDEDHINAPKFNFEEEEEEFDDVGSQPSAGEHVEEYIDDVTDEIMHDVNTTLPEPRYEENESEVDNDSFNEYEPEEEEKRSAPSSLLTWRDLDTLTVRDLLNSSDGRRRVLSANSQGSANLDMDVQIVNQQHEKFVELVEDLKQATLHELNRSIIKITGKGKKEREPKHGRKNKRREETPEAPKKIKKKRRQQTETHAHPTNKRRKPPAHSGKKTNRKRKSEQHLEPLDDVSFEKVDVEGERLKKALSGDKKKRRRQRH
ncbi:hypothetical protein PCE1_001412 [Barthelona sp. PCE]